MSVLCTVVAASLLGNASGLTSTEKTLVSDFYVHKRVDYLCYLSCEGQSQNVQLMKHLSRFDIRTSVRFFDGEARGNFDLNQLLHQWTAPVGVLLDLSCKGAQQVLDKASRLSLFDSTHIWLVLASGVGDGSEEYTAFQRLNLSVDADIAVATTDNGKEYRLKDVFNFGKIQGNDLENISLGTWRLDAGLNVSLEGFKYYNRWDFHNLTLRAVSVLLERPKDFQVQMLSDPQYRPGVPFITKACTPLLDILGEQHNFGFKIIIASRWVGSPVRNSTLAVTNALFWREQDISYTGLRIFPAWLDWVQPFMPPPTSLETKFYYLIPEKGVGNYENRFLSPLTPGVWVCIAVTLAVCALVLAFSAAIEKHPEPAAYAAYSVAAAICQQAYEDGINLLDQVSTSQGRRITLLTVGLTSMVLYNYYTSSVVSWLLNADAPTIASMDGLIASDLELVFENIGYTRSWLDNPGLYYFSGYKNTKEDELREKKVTKARRTVPLIQSAERGVQLMRTGAYAYHAEPYSASQVIGRSFSDRELCELGALPMMRPKPIYIMGQKRSPYKEFFSWSLMRLQERGHYGATRARVRGQVPPCSGSSPRALALGQAAPAFALLAQAAVLSTLILMLEILWRRVQIRRRPGRQSRKKWPVIVRITRRASAVACRRPCT